MQNTLVQHPSSIAGSTPQQQQQQRKRRAKADAAGAEQHGGQPLAQRLRGDMQGRWALLDSGLWHVVLLQSAARGSALQV